MSRSVVNFKYMCMMSLLCVLFECVIASDANFYTNFKSNFIRYKRTGPSVNNTNQNSTQQPSKANVANKEEKYTSIPPPTTKSNTSDQNHDSTRLNSKGNSGILKSMNSGALLRGFYVFFGLGAIVIMYIVVRTVRLRRKKTTVRKYGILANREDVEMTPLGAEDDDEDTTLFDANNHSRP